jgi:hypothetical protein
MIHGLRRCCFLASFLLLASSLGAYAQSVAAIPDEQAKERLSFIENALQSAQPRAKTWWYGWISGYSAGAVVQLGLAGAHWNDVKLDKSTPVPRRVRDRAFAQDMLVGGVTCVLGAGNLLITPFSPAYAAGKLRPMPEGTPEERRAKLLKAEELLRQCARREEEGRGWKSHALNLGANAAAGLVTSLAFHRRWTDGLVTFATNETVSLLNIFTQPHRAIRDLNNYEVKYLGKQAAYVHEQPAPQWLFSLYPGGFSVGLLF